MLLNLYRAFEPVLHFDDDKGNPLAGGWLCTFLAGTDIPVATYKDNTGTLNETEIELDGRGECVVFLDNTKEYKFKLYGRNKDGENPIWVKDHVTTNFCFDIESDGTIDVEKSSDGNSYRIKIRVSPEIMDRIRELEEKIKPREFYDADVYDATDNEADGREGLVDSNNNDIVFFDF